MPGNLIDGVKLNPPTDALAVAGFFSSAFGSAAGATAAVAVSGFFLFLPGRAAMRLLKESCTDKL